MAKFKRLILREIGETTEGYDYYISTSGDRVSASFTTPENTYTVKIKKRDSWLIIDFGVGTRMSAKATDEGEQFKVMATIMNIAKEVWERRDEFFDGFLEGFFFDPVSKPGESPSDTSRTRLYKAFIEKRFPNAHIEKNDDATYKVIPPSNTR